MKVKNTTEKSGSNGKSNRTNSKDGPLLGAVHRLSDDEEEIDVQIDEQTEDVKNGQLIYYEQDSEQTNIGNGQQRRRESQTEEPYPEAQSSQMATNFNFSAKQSVVWAELLYLL